MAERKGYARQEYIEGNTVRKLEPKRKPARPPKRKGGRTTTSYKVRRNQEKALQMDLPYLVVLMIASCCTLFICINYLQVRSDMTTRMDNIKKLEQELDAMKTENDTLQTRINTSVDLEYIYKIATEELGMVYANKDQILLYQQTESEYVRQYEDIPNY